MTIATICRREIMNPADVKVGRLAGRQIALAHGTPGMQAPIGRR